MDTYPTPQVDDSERRRGKRGRAFKSGKLVFGNFTEIVIDCLVVEISDEGARVETQVMIPVPERVTLKLKDGVEHRARRAWATGCQIGLEFIP